MATIVSDTGSGDFERLETGLHQAVCNNVVDLGLQPTPWGDKRKVALCFEFDAKMQDSRPFMITKIYTASLNERANLRHDLKSWRGKDFTEEELAQFDLDSIIGANCMINVTETSKGDKTYSNIGGITPLLKGLDKIARTGQKAPDWVMKLAENGKKLSIEEQFAEESPSDESGLPF